MRTAKYAAMSLIAATTVMTGAATVAAGAGATAPGATSAVQTVVPQGSMQYAREHGINVRSAPHLGAGIVGSLGIGQGVWTVENPVPNGGGYGPVCGDPSPNNMWAKVIYEGQERFVATPCLQSSPPLRSH